MGRRVQTTEQTGKRWKALQALGCLGSLAGLAVFAAGLSTIRAGQASGDPRIGAAGMGLVFASMSVWLLGRLGAWWNHG